MAGIGQWISPGGVDLTNATNDPFDINIGGGQDPASLLIQQRNGHVLTRSFEGVYTCIMPDEDGLQTFLRVGIYQNGFNSKNYRV